MIDALNMILGREYTPVTTDMWVQTADGFEALQVVAGGTAGIDYPYVLSALLLVVMLYCLIRLLGGILRA